MFEEVTPGGGFLVANVPLGKIFSREQFSDIQKEFADMASKFIQNEVVPKAEEIENKAMEGDVPLAIKLTKEAGQLGLVGIDIPEEYGGLGQDKTTSMLVAEAMAGCPSFGATMGAHAGIGTLPITLFGNDEQKKQWLPQLASAELISCYALTEPESGSDALSGRATAVPTEDGKYYIMNGEKQFITNGSWADIGVVFAQVEGKYSGFIVDLRTEGCSRGAEEKKMGIKGSSTTNLIFEDCKVPAENMLGKPGMAAAIALNILNLGRLKLGFGALGNCKYTIDLTTKFTTERKQFGQPIISFDMQKGKLADMVADTFAVDSAAYRAVGDIDRTLEKVEKDEKYLEKMIEILRTYALECSIIKIAGSETLQDVATTAIKMHGGYGFVQEYKVEMISRDNVVDTIFEGTNDINRLTIFDTLARNIFGAQMPFREFMESVDAELRSGKIERAKASGPLAEEVADCVAAKKVVAYTVNQALIHCGKNIKNEQQVMESIADMLVALYKMDSTVARVQQIIDSSSAAKAKTQIAIAKLVCHKNGQIINEKAEDIVSSVTTKGQLGSKLVNLDKLSACLDRPTNVVRLKRTIGDTVIEAGGYKL